MSEKELEFIHEIVNKLTMINGRVDRILKKSEKFSKEDILSLLNDTKAEIDEAFKVVGQRRKDLKAI